MQPDPQPTNRQQRLHLADVIVERLSVHYTALLKAIGLYESAAHGQGRPYVDIELFCILTDPGKYRNYEWCPGPWKAVINVRGETELCRETIRPDGRWAVAQSRLCAYPILPLMDPGHFSPGYPTGSYSARQRSSGL
jgi:hypothetical protein